MPKRAFFFWSEAGSSLFLARRLKCEGHPVLLYLKDPAAQDVGTGLVPKTTSPVPPKGAIVVFDGIGRGIIGRELRRVGHPVIGGNLLDKRLEADRPEGARIMRQHGIKTPLAVEFWSVPAAIRYLDRQSGEWFVKAIGTDTPECATYNAQVEELQRYLRALEGKLAHFQLSPKAIGTEVSTNGWFDGKRFVLPFDFTIEEKRFLAGNLGPRTGCESNLVWMDHKSPLPGHVLLPLEAMLREEGYVGPLDLNALVDTEGHPLGLEWTARFGFDAVQAWSHLFDRTLGEQLDSFAQGDLPRWDLPSNDLAMTLRVSMPPYPLWEPPVARKSKGLPLDPQWLTHPLTTVEDVMQGPNGLAMAGRDGLIGTVGALGEDVLMLIQEVLALAKHLRVPNKQYRIDPLTRAVRDLTELVRLGLAGHPALERQFGKRATA